MVWACGSFNASLKQAGMTLNDIDLFELNEASYIPIIEVIRTWFE
jgi:acetyl-CoA acetyltransferase